MLLGQCLPMYFLLCLALDSHGVECTGRCCTLCLETSSLRITIKNISFDVGSYDLKLFGSSKPLASASGEAGTPASPTTQSLRNPNILQQTVSKSLWPWPRGISQLCNAAQQTNSFSPREMLSVSWGVYSATLLKKRNQIESCQLCLQDVRNELGQWLPAVCTCLLDFSGPSLAFGMQHTHIFLSLSLRIAFWLHTATA